MHGEGVRQRQLGRTDIYVSPIGLGTWQFASGQGVLGSHWAPVDAQTTRAIVEHALQGGINWFDTAEAYGDGASERHLALALRAIGTQPGEVVIADKWWPKHRKARSLLATIAERKRCLQGYPIDLYQIHWPESQSWLRTEMQVLARLVEQGDVRAVGLCNYSRRFLTRAHKLLARRGIPLASVQVRYSLLHRSIETNGVLRVAQELGMTVIAWSPLEQGLLTGRFHADPSSMLRVTEGRKQMIGLSRERLDDTQDLIAGLQRIAVGHQATVGQVALSWLITFHGETVVAIPGASGSQQVAENAGAMAVQLSADELDEIDRLSQACLSMRSGLG